MPETPPQFLPHYRVEVVPPNLVFLLEEKGHRVLRGRPYSLLAPHLGAGQLSTDEIVDALAGQLEPAEVYYCLERLSRQGLLLNSGETMVERGEAAFWSAQGVDPGQARRHQDQASVNLVGLGEVESAALRQALTSLGIACVEDSTTADFTVVLVDDYLHPELEAINRRQLTQRRPWLLAKPGGLVAWLGPLFVPANTACWECLAVRLRRNREVESFVAEAKGLANLATSISRLPTTLTQAAAQTATEIARYLASETSPLEDQLLTIDHAELEQEFHKVARYPDCPACGHPASPEVEPIVLQKRAVLASDDAGYRVFTPEQAWETYKEQVSPITGVVQKLVRTDQSGGLAPVYVAGHNQAQASMGYQALRAGLRSQASGKGKTDMQARVSGLCEAIERYSGVYRGGEKQRRASFADLGSQAIHPARCLLFSQDQYERRNELNLTLPSMHSIPRPFEDDEVVAWSPLWSLTAGEPRYLPTSFCYYNSQDSLAQRCPAVFSNSNGNAAGSTLEDAILQGFLELVERDAVALWWYNRLAMPGCDLDSLNDPYLSRLGDYYKTLGRKFWVLDVTSDLGIPTYAAVSASTEGGAEEILLGFGSHLEARLAVLRAVEEMNQSLPHLLSWKRGDGQMEALTAKFWRRATVARQGYLQPAGLVPVRPPSPISDLKTAVETCQQLVERRGMEFLVLDQTRPDIGLPVVKVVVPGMRHFWPRFAPGRLYDVPVEMGLRETPLAESELNRIPMIL